MQIYVSAIKVIRQTICASTNLDSLNTSAIVIRRLNFRLSGVVDYLINERSNRQ